MIGQPKGRSLLVKKNLDFLKVHFQMTLSGNSISVPKSSYFRDIRSMILAFNGYLQIGICLQKN